MFNHVMVGSNDLDKSRAFYDALLAPLGMSDTPYEGRLRYMGNGALLIVVKPRHSYRPHSAALSRSERIIIRGDVENFAAHPAVNSIRCKT